MNIRIIVLLSLLAIFASANGVQSLTVTSVKLTPSKVYFTSPTIPSVTIFFTTDQRFQSGAVIINNEYSTSLSPINIINDGPSKTNVTVCIPWTQVKCLPTNGATSLDCPIRVSLFNGVDYIDVQVTQLFPAAGKLTIYTGPPSTLTSLSVSQSSTSLFFKFQIAAGSSGFRNGQFGLRYYKQSGQDEIVNYNIQLSDANADGFYYVTVNPPTDRRLATIDLANLVLYNSAGVPTTYTTFAAFNLPPLSIAPPQWIPSPIVLADSVTPLTNLSYTYLTHVVAVNFLLNSNPNGFYDIEVRLWGPNADCTPVLSSPTNITAYCLIPAYFNNGTYTFRLLLKQYSGQPLEYFTTSTLTYINTNTGVPSLGNSITFNVPSINQLQPFHLETNVSFSSPGSGFANAEILRYVYANPNDIVQGDINDGVISIRSLFDSANDELYLPWGGRSTITNDQGNTASQYYSTSSIPTVTPRVLPANAVLINATLPKTVNLNSLTAVPIYFNVTSTQLVEGSAYLLINDKISDQARFSYQDGLLSSNNNLLTYQTGLSFHPTQFPQPGAYSVFFNFFQQYSDYANHQCVSLIYTRPSAPTVLSFSFTPNPIVVTNGAVEVTFVLTLDKATSNSSSVLVQFDQHHFTFSQTTVVPLYQVVNVSSPVATFSGSWFVPKNTFSFTSNIDLVLQDSKGYAVYTISSAKLRQTPSLASTISVQGTAVDLVTRPVLTSFSNNGPYSAFVKATSVTPMASVRFFYNENQFGAGVVFYENNFLDNPTTSFNDNVYFFVQCNKLSTRTRVGLPSLVLEITDVNGQVFTYSYAYIKSIFPSYTPPYVQCDVAAPRIASLTAPSSINTGSSGSIANIDLTITDNQSGFKEAVIVVSSNGINQFTLLADSTNRLSGGDNNGVYRVSFPVGLHSNAVYTLSVESLSDNAGNVITLTSQDLQLVSTTGLSTITTTSPTVDSVGAITKAVFSKIVADGATQTLTVVTTGAVQRVYIVFSSDVSNRIPVPSIGNGQFRITFVPSAYGNHYFSIFLVGPNDKTVSFTQSTYAFYYLGGSFAAGRVQSIQTVRNYYTITGTFTIAQLSSNHDEHYCYLTDDSGVRVGGNIQSVAGVANTYQCIVDVAPFVGSKTFHWSFQFSALRPAFQPSQQSPVPTPRFISSYELLTQYGVNPNIQLTF
ncbi:hypothetical protein SAMD00019534_048270 [Acytostelium subglobosum LB1]|uniref:hypothetical protein n=1 Tax=Acytostelium subglobosum LB1 TaxID=1410327 RepID=UPI000644EA52|nr:hypothetical protein SAMD00019534_048270 [Acytostelium subglobosum LB1]GAM21652.1 hypothetical protein SAMD00019534_048270 [Acytostelium subglobosum LB1]|eukprot:XP_012755771.1 hypothetical protein SAMD00019534_048270 [Acytostelium subglobosum LB1]